MLYELYESMMNAYKNNDNENFVVYACNWIEATNENPFTEKIPHELFFNAKKYCRNWRRGGIDCRSARRNMIRLLKELAMLDLANPYNKEEYQKQKKKEEQFEDVSVTMLSMVKAYNLKNDEAFREATVRFMNSAKENPFVKNTNEYDRFEEMKQAYTRNPANMRRVFVVAEQLCDIINYTEIEPEEIKKVIKEEPETVLGVVPEKEKEKKSWLRFLHPPKKEGE